MFNFQEKRYTQHNILMTWRNFYDLKQLVNESVQEYYERFKLQVKVFESLGGTFGLDKALLLDESFKSNKNTTVSDLKKVAKNSKEK